MTVTTSDPSPRSHGISSDLPGTTEAATFTVTTSRLLGAPPDEFAVTSLLCRRGLPVAAVHGSRARGRLVIHEVVGLRDVDAVICILELVLGLGGGDVPIGLAPSVVARLGLGFLEGVVFEEAV